MATFTGDGSANTITGTTDADDIYGNGGNDVIDGGDGDDYVDGGSMHDVLFGGRGNDELLGGAGNDELNGGEDDDILNGGTGTDWASFDGGGAVNADLTLGVATGQGSDTLISIERLRGSSFADRLKGSATNNTLMGGDGNDVLIATGGTDILNGGADFDTVSFEAFSSGVTASLAGGSYTSASGNGQMSAVEALVGSAFNDVLTGNGGDNTFDGGAGDDVIDGRGGIDTVSYASLAASTNVTVDLGTGAASVRQAFGAVINVDTLTRIENVIGSSGQDTLRGSAGNNVLNGGGAADVLQASLGVDHLDGGAGDGDTVEFSGVGAVTASLASGTYTINAGAHGTMANIDNLVGGDLADTLSGNAQANYIVGGAGADTLSGGAGVDNLWGGAGSDRLIADGGDDFLFGNLDRFGQIFDSAADVFEITAAAGSVTIADFQVGVDKLDLSAFGFDQNGVSSYWTGSGVYNATGAVLSLSGQQGELVTITLNGVTSGLSVADMVGGSQSLLTPPTNPNGGNGVPDVFLIDPTAQTVSVGGVVVASGQTMTLVGFEDGLDQFDLRAVYAQGWDGTLAEAQDGSVILVIEDAYSNHIEITVEDWTMPQVDVTDYIW